MNMTFKSLLFGAAEPNKTSLDLVYTLFRFYCGISMALGAGLSKVFHKIDENGSEAWDNLAFGVPDWFVKQVGEIGFTFISPAFWATLAVYGEFIGGLFIAFGLLTRISALQMAFQFFVVSFLWYDEPMPFAMYYQQLIFWSFVLIALMGGGRFSMDNWLTNRSKAKQLHKSLVVSICCLLFAASGSAQTTAEPARVRFTLSNPSLKSHELEIRGFDYADMKRIGYGCRLGALQSRSDNKPVGTRVYIKRDGAWVLAFVLSAEDDGRKFNLSQNYEISPQQRAQVALDEQSEQNEALKDVSENPDLASVSRSLGLEMVSFDISGKNLFGKQVHVRAQLPFDSKRSNHGFSQRISLLKDIRVSYPVGTKIYLCEGAYWNGPVPETLLFTVSNTQKNVKI